MQKPGTRWTEREREFVRTSWGTLTRRMIAKKLKKALTSVNRLANEMGLARAVRRSTYDDARRLPEFVICSQDSMCQAFVADLADNEQKAERALEHQLKLGRPAAIYRKLHAAETVKPCAPKCSCASANCAEGVTP